MSPTHSAPEMPLSLSSNRKHDSLQGRKQGVPDSTSKYTKYQAMHIQAEQRSGIGLLNTDVLGIIILDANQHEDIWAIAQTSKQLHAAVCALWPTTRSRPVQHIVAIFRSPSRIRLSVEGEMGAVVSARLKKTNSGSPISHPALIALCATGSIADIEAVIPTWQTCVVTHQALARAGRTDAMEHSKSKMFMELAELGGIDALAEVYIYPSAKSGNFDVLKWCAVALKNLWLRTGTKAFPAFLEAFDDPPPSGTRCASGLVALAIRSVSRGASPHKCYAYLSQLSKAFEKPWLLCECREIDAPVFSTAPRKARKVTFLRCCARWCGHNSGTQTFLAHYGEAPICDPSDIRYTNSLAFIDCCPEQQDRLAMERYRSYSAGWFVRPVTIDALEWMRRETRSAEGWHYDLFSSHQMLQPIDEHGLGLYSNAVGMLPYYLQGGGYTGTGLSYVGGDTKATYAVPPVPIECSDAARWDNRFGPKLLISRAWQHVVMDLPVREAPYALEQVAVDFGIAFLWRDPRAFVAATLQGATKAQQTRNADCRRLHPDGDVHAHRALRRVLQPLLWQLAQACAHAEAEGLVQALLEPSIEATSYRQVAEVAGELLREWAQPGALAESDVLVPGGSRSALESRVFSSYLKSRR